MEILLILVLIVVGSLGYLYFSNKKTSTPKNNNVSQQQKNSESTSYIATEVTQIIGVALPPSYKQVFNFLDVNKEYAEVKLTEVGIYKIIVMIDDEEKVFSLFVSLPEEESDMNLEVVDMDLYGELGNNYSDGIYDKLIILFIVLAVIFMADWVVYCYEQYQLR